MTVIFYIPVIIYYIDTAGNAAKNQKPGKQAWVLIPIE
jgi:hypothetical protein